MTTLPRRTVLKTASGLALTAASGVAAAEPAVAKPGDFDFLAGEWRIKNRRLKSPGVWDEFNGEATCWTILNGAGSVEELRIPARDFSGMGLRLLDVEKQAWKDHWVNAKSGILGGEGVPGVFKDGVGIFDSKDMEDGKPVIWRGVWDRITGRAHRWYQAVSRDDGKTWQETWLMDWTRVS